MAEPLEMLFGMMSGLGPRNSVLCPGENGGNVPDKRNTPMNCKLNWSIQRHAHDRQMLDCKR